MPKKKVLVTGMSGRIGKAILKHLGPKYDFTALNRRPMEGVRSVTGDITNLASIQSHFQGQDVVVHLAAALSNVSFDDILQRNILGTYNVFEAARQAGVKRVVFASSGSIVLNYTLDSPYRELESGEYHKLPPTWPKITHRDPIRPKDIYGASKAWGEALGRYYFDTHGISVLCVRFGWLPEDDRPSTLRTFSVWCSHRDAAQMVQRCIDAPHSVGFDIFFCTSDNKYSYRDLTHARDVLGYVPQDRAEEWRGR
jgi:nucleoside-diphosphate-sugar epimerase